MMQPKKSIIYADNAATTQIDEAAFEAMKPYLLYEFGNASQAYSLARAPKKAMQEAREAIAACIGAHPEEIFFTSGGTESDNWAIKGAVLCGGARRAIVTTAFEHHAVLNACKAAERQGAPVAYIRPNREGQVTPDALKSCVTSDTLLVSVMHANNEIGSIQPIAELCKAAHSKGALFHTDAVQSIGHVSVKVGELGVDMLSASAHKFNGAKGAGFLYVRKGTPIAPFLDGGAQESGLRAGTENVAGIVCMAAALRRNVEGLQENTRHILNLEERLLRALNSQNIAFTRNGGARTLPGLISLSFAGFDGEAILHRLDLMGIAVATGSACNSGNAEISHVLKAIGLEEKLAHGTIRISLGKYNTEEDVDTIVRGLGKAVGSR